MINQVIKKYFNNKFINFEVVYNNGITSTVPLDPANSDYQEILEWVAEGNTIIDNGGA